MSFKSMLVLLLLHALSIGYCQKKANSQSAALFVPFKVQDLFGIATEDGTLVVPPQFDHVTLINAPNVFTAYTYGPYKTYRSSLIINDKVILQDQPFFAYYAYQDLILAIRETGGKGSGYYSLRSEAIELFTYQGQKITPEAFNHVQTFPELDPQNTLSHMLLYCVHADQTYSLVLYDKKTKQFTTSWVDKAKDIDFTDLDMMYRTRELKVKYVDAKNQGRELTIGIKGNALVKTFEGTYVVQPKSSGYSLYNESVAVPDWDIENQPKIQAEAFEIEAKKLELRREYQLGYQPHKLQTLPQKLDPKYRKIIFENGKKGLINPQENTVTLPVLYDEFYMADFKGIHASGYVVLQNGKYSLMVYGFGNKPPQTLGMFDHLPFITYYEYGRSDFHLIGLFDTNGQFLYYASPQGKVYYSP